MAGWTYVFDLRGRASNPGADWFLGDPMLRGLYDSEGNFIRGTRDRDSGCGNEARVIFTATETGTYYIAAAGERGSTGDYSLRVNRKADWDAWRQHATDLGDLAALEGRQAHRDSVDGRNDATDYFRFTLTEAKKVKFKIWRQDADADLYLEDENGRVLASSTLRSAQKDVTVESLQPGTYFVRVAAREDGENSYRLVYRVGEPDPGAGFPVTGPVEGNVAVPPGVEPGLQPQRVIQNSVWEPGGTVFAADVSTQGQIAVNSIARGNIGRPHDRDWFAVTLEAGHTYRIEMKGFDGRGAYGTLWNPYLRGIHDAEGNLIEGTSNNDAYRSAGDSHVDQDSRVLFTPTESSVYYVAAGSTRQWLDTDYRGPSRGTYTVVVTDTSADDFSADSDTPGRVPIGGTATGRIENLDDVDWFAVTLEKSTTYQFDQRGSSSGHSLKLKGPDLRGIYDAEGNLIPDTGEDGRGGRVVCTAPEDGVYYVAANADPSYGTTVPSSGDPVNWYGSVAAIDAVRMNHLGAYALSVAKIPDDFTADTDTDGRVEVGGSAAGEIGHRGDRDWFAVTLEAGMTYQFDLLGSSPVHARDGSPSRPLKYHRFWPPEVDTTFGTLADPALHGIHDAEGKLIAGTATADGGAGQNSRVTFKADADATYYVAAGAEGENLGAYALAVEEVPADVM